MDDQLASAVVMPQALAHLADEPELAYAWEQQVTARRAEAAKITALLDYGKRLIAEYADTPAALRCEVERVAAGDAAALLGVSEMTATIMLGAAGVARDFLPVTWTAFQDGLIDMLRVRKITTAAEEVSDELLPQVDAAAAEQAASRGIGDFHRWLTRHIARVDFDAYNRLCASRRTERYVRFEHGTGGMSFLEARIPTVEAAAIEQRIKITARRHHNTPTCEDRATDNRTVDERTLAQREADLLSAWLRTGDTPEEGARPVDAKIMIPETTLTGETNEPAMAADRSWMLDADQARALAANPDAEHHWYQGRTRPNRTDADVDVLSVTYAGRCPPQRLREALLFRDGVCAAQGCTIPAERCDLDHQIPWDAGGPTDAGNLAALCRRHHRRKSHRLLNRRQLPSRSGADPPVDLLYGTHTIAPAA
ncbi:MAG: DUF222 domain-containing protein [Nesterenkonia sp.]